MNRSFRSFKAFLITVLLLAGRNAFAQHTEVLTTGGMNSNQSHFVSSTGGDHLNFQLSLKVGRLFPNRMGIGLVFEAAKFTSDIKFTLPFDPQSTFEYTVEVANPQNFMGLELYRKFFVSKRSCIRLGGVVGYAFAQGPGLVDILGLTYRGYGWGCGLDAAFVFPLAPQLSGVFNAGLRYYDVKHEGNPTAQHIKTRSIPLTIGLNCEIGRNRRKQQQSSVKDGE